MRICQVCPYDFSMPGGVQTHIRDLSITLSNQGHEVSILTVRVNREMDSAINKFLVEAGNSFRFNGLGTSFDITYSNRRHRQKLLSYLGNSGFDLVHLHTPWSPLMPFQVMRLARQEHIPLIATFHDTPANSPIGKLLGKYVMPRAANFFLKRLNATISVSESQARYLDPKGEKGITIIPNGIDTNHYQQQVSLETGESSAFRILFLGRLEPRKGVFDALDVFEDLNREFERLELTIAGAGPLESQIQQRIAGLGLDNVTMRGYVSEQQKLYLLHNSDVLIAPALYGESFGIILLEAMAAGLPVVGYGNEGYWNVARDYAPDFFPAPGERETLSKKMKILIQ